MMTRYLQDRPQLVWLIVSAIFVTGLFSFFAMPQVEDPFLKRRIAVVSVSMVGADADQIESSVVIPIEEWLVEFSEIKKVRSNTRTNVANIVVELADSVSKPADVWAAIERKLRTNESRLPENCSAIDLEVFPLKAFAAVVAVVPDSVGSDLRLEGRIASELKARILQIGGTESVSLFGAPDEQIVIRVFPEKLFDTGLSTSNIARQIADNNVLPVGNVNIAGHQMAVDLDDSEDVLDKLKNLTIQSPGWNTSIRLGDLAEVSVDSQDPPTDVAIAFGKKSVVVAAMVDNQQRVDVWTRKMRREIQRLENELIGDYTIQPLFVQSDQIELRMSNLLSNLAISGAVVMLIVFLLMGWRCMLVIGITLPLTACIVICGLRFLSIPIHQMSVTGLIVSLGLLIDNAIVVVEDARSRIFSGVDRLQSILQTVSHLRLPLLGSTATTILTFIPIAMMPGPPGEFVGSLAISVILSISASLLLAFTIVPPLVLMVGVATNQKGLSGYGIRPGFFGRLYRRSLELAYCWPVLGILLGILLPVCGLWQASNIERQFFPASDRPQIQIEVELGSSSNILAVEEIVNQIRMLLDGNPMVSNQHWFLGQSAPPFYYNVVPRRRSSRNYAQAFVDLNKAEEIDSIVNELQTNLDDNILNARVVVRKLEQGPPFDAPVEFRILGDDLELLQHLGSQVRQILAAHRSVVHTRADLTDQVPELKFQSYQELLRRNNISPRQLSLFLYSHLQSADAGSLYYRDQTLPIRVEVNFSGRTVTETLMAMNASSGFSTSSTSGKPTSRRTEQNFETPKPTRIPLGSLGDFDLIGKRGTIVRTNGRRTNEVKAYLRSGVLAANVADDVKRKLLASGFVLPSGYKIEIGGEEEKRNQAITSLVANIVIIVALMVLTLVGVLGSIRSGAIIFCVAGLSIGLGPLALASFGFPFGFMAIVGTMGLIGVAINDSIVILAAIRSRDVQREVTQNKNHNFESAISDETPERNASLARNMLEHIDHSELVQTDTSRIVDIVYDNTRHILATTLTTILGFLPLVLFGGKFWPPLAIVFSAGVGGATLLALYFVPALVVILHRNNTSSQN